MSVPPVYGQQDKSAIQLDELQGTWKFDYAQSKARIEKSKKDRFGLGNAAMNAKTEELYKGRIYVFNSDNSFELRAANGASLKGKWELSQNGKRLTFNYPSGTARSYRVVSSDNSQLVLKEDASDKDKRLFTELFLIKQ